ncbi:DUF4258 domain-containing protein [Sulfuriflexus mobilis]|uniref:DUF4258 domain-containing protein n=1 Tax=Sulfuriflexus mobilis TaxID=1811807 RepID=UPI000F840724
MTQRRALQLIRTAAQETDRVEWSSHAKKRMRQRKVSMTQVLRVLKTGGILEGPYEDIKTGHWKCRLEQFTAGDNVNVVVAIERNEDSTPIIIVTAME